MSVERDGKSITVKAPDILGEMQQMNKTGQRVATVTAKSFPASVSRGARSTSARKLVSARGRPSKNVGVGDGRPIFAHA